MQQRHLSQQEDVPSPHVGETSPTPQHSMDAEAQALSSSPVATEQAETLGAALSQETQQFRRGIARGIAGISTLAVFLVAASLIFGKARESEWVPADAVVPSLLSLLLVFSLYVVRASRKPRQYQRALTTRVAEQDDLRSIGSLMDALALDDDQTRKIATKALITLLPRLQASDASLLTPAQRARLCQVLSAPIENPLYKDVRTLFQPADQLAINLRVAILRALEQVGDSKALPVVTQLAQQKPKTPGERRIQEAAIACLPALQLRVEQAQSSQTLLRASQPSVATPDTLLRAASGGQEVEPNELLRASEPVPGGG